MSGYVTAADSAGCAVFLPCLVPVAVRVRSVTDAGPSCAGGPLVLLSGVRGDGSRVTMHVQPSAWLERAVTL